MSVYSFQDVVAAITGVGGSINLANGAGAASEGITVESTVDKSTMLIGADGQGQHSLSADESSTVTVRLLKTSPINAQLNAMFAVQSRSSAAHGKNVITIRDSQRGDLIMLTGVAFKKRPTVTYAAEGGLMEWTFDAIATVPFLGTGTPSV